MGDSNERLIWAPYQAFYIQSMLFNAESAASSITKINATMHVVFENSPEDPLSALPVQYLLNELQNVLVQAAALSRYFWPVRASHVWRGEHLRRAFQLPEDSPLRSRGLRNAIEHFDEQLDRYLEDGVVGHILPQYVGPFSESDGVPVHLFRAYYIDKGVFELLGKRYDVNPIAGAVMAIYEQLKEMDQAGGIFSS